MLPLVTIITACYNGARFMNTYAQSILSQTYENIEVIFADDGSTDDSAVRMQNYAEIFQQRNIKFTYLYQKNQGQAAATNLAFQHLQGKYFCLFDVDDILEPTCIEKRVCYLESHKDCGFVRSNIWNVYEGKNDRKIKFPIKSGTTAGDWIFEDLLADKIRAFPIFYLFRTSAFLQVCPTKTIYPSRYTQDVQVVLPIAYHFKCGFIEECLGCYLHHQDSHSHSFVTSTARLELWNGWEDVWITTLKSMQIEDCLYLRYEKKVKDRIRLIKQQLLLEMLWENLDDLPPDICGRKYFIFGVGDDGRNLARMLQAKGLNVSGFIDNDALKHGMTVDGIKVIGIEDEQIVQDEKFCILIATRNFQTEIEEQLKNIPFKEGQEYCLYQKYIFDCVAARL